MTTEYESVSSILPRLFLTSIGPSLDKEKLKKYKITHIVNASQFPNMYEDEFSYLYVDVEDDPQADIKQHFDTVSNFIHNALEKHSENRVLVHCSAGMSRSPTLVVAYLIQKEFMHYKQALSHVYCKRNCIDINSGFMKQLESLWSIIKNKE